jgi:D-alanyl-D-alanine carboxypeptidase (penicillin-binding protein 5/6)
MAAMVLGSGNDAAGALARAAGGVPATLAAMDATAHGLGAFDTVAGTPSGLDVAGQSSSPYDLALVFRALLADPRTAAVLRTPRITVPPEMGRPGFEVDNQDRMLTGYPGDLGGKNGFTNAARHTFVTAAERGGRRLVVTVMGTERRPVSETDQAARLLDWGFSVGPGAEPVGRLVRPEDLTTSPSASPTPPGGPADVATGAAGPRSGAASRSSVSLVPALLGAIGVLVVALAGGLVTLRRWGRRSGRRTPSGPP